MYNIRNTQWMCDLLKVIYKYLHCRANYQYRKCRVLQQVNHSFTVGKSLGYYEESRRRIELNRS